MNMKKKYTYKAVIRHDTERQCDYVEWLSGKPRTTAPLEVEITTWEDKSDLNQHKVNSDGDTYTASLRGDCLEWMTMGVNISEPIEVSITVMDKQLSTVRDEDRERTYEAVLHGKRVEWLNGKPEASHELEVSVKVPIMRWKSEAERKAALRDALDKLSRSGAFADIEDPVAWQREIRKDRQLPGRD